MKNLFFASILLLISSFFSPVFASQGQVLGVHILHPGEVSSVRDLLTENNDEWHYVTIPFSLVDVDKLELWDDFFHQAKEHKIIPLVRLASKFEDQAWSVPSRYEVVRMLNALSALDWSTDERYIIIFNEPNHAKEWGGKIDPVSYAQTLEFAAAWAKTEDKNFKILPAGLDLAAANTSETMESSLYLSKMLAYNPDLFDNVDYWNSHSYPNPGFSSSPTRTGKNSISGFKYELELLKQKTGREFEVFITETGWQDNIYTNRYLESYYTYALQHVWSDERVKCVTPFLLQGSPGPFASFSFLDAGGQPTAQYLALQKALRNVD